MKDEAFEQYWLVHKKEWLQQNDEYRSIEEGYKMRSGFDWLLWALPLVSGVVAFSVLPLMSELLKWILSAVVVVVVFMICVWIKSAMLGQRSLSVVENEVKQQAYQWFKEKLNQS